MVRTLYQNGRSQAAEKGAKRRPGCPKHTWLRTVKEDLKLEGGGKTIEYLEEMALDRSRRRLWTALGACARGKN